VILGGLCRPGQAGTAENLPAEVSLTALMPSRVMERGRHATHVSDCSSWMPPTSLATAVALGKMPTTSAQPSIWPLVVRSLVVIRSLAERRSPRSRRSIGQARKSLTRASITAGSAFSAVRRGSRKAGRQGPRCSFGTRWSTVLVADAKHWAVAAALPCAASVPRPSQAPSGTRRRSRTSRAGRSGVDHRDRSDVGGVGLSTQTYRGSPRWPPRGFHFPEPGGSQRPQALAALHHTRGRDQCRTTVSSARDIAARRRQRRSRRRG